MSKQLAQRNDKYIAKLNRVPPMCRGLDWRLAAGYTVAVVESLNMKEPDVALTLLKKAAPVVKDACYGFN
jgi:hypothetical protein